MHSPVHPAIAMELREIEPGLEVYQCPRSAGLWIPLQSYLAWKERHPADTATSLELSPPPVQDDSRQRALICPESGRLLLRYRVGHGLQFHVDRSPATGGVWLDKGEWEALKGKGLHVALHLIFTAAYQRQVRISEYTQTLSETFRDRIGEPDFTRVGEFGAWLAHHPKRRDIFSYLLNRFDEGSEPGAAPNDGSSAPPTSVS